jgi:alpha-L-arabinofuranosidase
MMEARLKVDASDTVASVDRRLYGSFVEHLGRVVYTGVYEPDHPTADEDGFRTDVLDLVRELGVSLVRYPGGNFVSAYRWEDGVGPKEQRPTRAEPAWRVRESNQFGVDEFVAWARKADLEPMMVVNLGTRGVAEAQDLVEYCNLAGGTYWSDKRRAYGTAKPHNVRLWGLGNEMDGPWQVGHKTAQEYGRLATETARGMRYIDPTIELVLAGSSLRRMPTFPEWDATVLEHAYDDVDYLGLHGYYRRDDQDLSSYLASAVDLDAFLDEAVTTCDYVKAKIRSAKQMNICFDEWNVTHQEPAGGIRYLEPWTQAPRFDEYDADVVDAVVIGTLLNSFLRHADRVRVACQSLLVNVGGLIRTEPGGPAWRQTSFLPLAAVARFAGGEVLRLRATSPVYDSETQERVPYLDAAATYTADTDALAVFAVNRHPTEAMLLEVQLLGSNVSSPVRHLWLDAASDVTAHNSAAAPNAVTPTEVTLGPPEAGTLTVELPALSWNVIRFGIDR